MPKIELTEVETLLIEQRQDAEHQESRKINRIANRLRRFQQQATMRNLSVFAIVAKAHGQNPPPRDVQPRYSVGRNGCGVLEWDDPKPAEAPAPPTQEPAPAPSTASDPAAK